MLGRKEGRNGGREGGRHVLSLPHSRLFLWPRVPLHVSSGTQLWQKARRPGTHLLLIESHEGRKEDMFCLSPILACFLGQGYPCMFLLVTKGKKLLLSKSQEGRKEVRMFCPSPILACFWRNAVHVFPCLCMLYSETNLLHASFFAISSHASYGTEIVQASITP